MRKLRTQLRSALLEFWRGLRHCSGDSAYEIYLACAQRQKWKQPLSAKEFYIEQLKRKYSRPNRCC